MKKKTARLRLNRETLLMLHQPLQRVAGGYSNLPGLCNPSLGAGVTECASRCLQCPDTGGES
jgi:hypothetical protein